jgi:Glyoxalase-like domain
LSAIIWFAVLDHLVYAAPDLDVAIQDLESRLGVRPGYGGKHAGGLTHNALLSLGEGSYLEIIASVPGAAESGTPLAFGLDTLEEPRLVTWSMKAPDIDSRIEEARASGYDPGDPVDGGRDLPDGSRLSWRVSLRPQLAGDGVVPFLTQWRSEPHPSETAPDGCRFVSLRAVHPEPESVLPMLRALSVDLPVTAGDSPGLFATLETPNGRVELS